MSEKLNGSVGRLAVALGDVVREAAESVRDDVRKDMREVEERLNTRIDRVAGDVRDAEERLGNRIDRAVEDIVAERQRESTASTA